MRIILLGNAADDERYDKSDHDEGIIGAIAYNRYQLSHCGFDVYDDKLNAATAFGSDHSSAICAGTLTGVERVMATSCSYMVSTRLSMVGWTGGGRREVRNRRAFLVSAQQQQQTDVEEAERKKVQEVQEQEQAQTQKPKPKGTKPRPVEPQMNVKSRNIPRDYGGQWLSTATRHVRIYAAYIDPETSEFDQTQMDKLTLILDPTDEFVWNPETCNMVYSYFQELVDHYEGAPLTEYTLRLIGSDIEHYIRKMLYDGVIKYNMNARVLNFSMGKPRIMFNNNTQPGDTLEK
ncbi:hypothetical protein VNO77_10266 [Canavalia gladiata]|uniref:NAD(P)H-quinone oxidoreductase subunit M, chloroplastic n=1 Tax=Canavalia gladiata TaxID=3824 RepID=A0AAN9MAT9_CANGL